MAGEPADFDPLTVPAVMPVSVRRIAEGGFPTQFLLDYEQALQQWMKSNVANTNTRMTYVFEQVDGAYAAVTVEANARASADEALAEQITTVEAQVGENSAAIVAEILARTTADEALASDITTLTTRVGDAESSITDEITARSTADSTLAGQITTLNSSLGTTNANLSSEASTRASADSALSGSISTLSTTVGGHTSSISTLTSSVNGLAVKYAVTGTINGVTGGFVFTGVQQAGGGAVYNLEITSNVIINGNLLVNGTILNGAAASRAFTQGVGASSGGTSTSVNVTTRGAAQVLVIANFNGASGGYFPIATSVGVFQITRNGGNLQTVANNYEASGSGGSAGIAFQQTCLLAIDTPPAGSNTFACGTNNGGGVGGVTIAVIELSK